jgi:hypothetical protein
VEYATRPSRSRLPPAPARRVGRSPAVAAPLGLVSNPKPFAAPPPRRAKRPTTTWIRVSTNHRIVKEAADPRRDEPEAVRPWRLARGRGRPARRPRPAPRRRRRATRTPRTAATPGGGPCSVDRGPAGLGRIRPGGKVGRPTSAVEDETLTAAWSRCKGRVRFPLSRLSNPRGEQAYGRLLGIRGGADEPWGVGEGGLAATLAW